MRFVRYRFGRENRPAYMQADYVVDIEAALRYFDIDGGISERIVATPLELLALDLELFPIVQALAEQSMAVLGEADFARLAEEIEYLPPVSNPGKVLCVGLNYFPPEGDADFSLPEYPILFHKVVSSLTGHRQPILLPKISQEVDYEGELAVVIGKRGKQIPPESAFKYIAGYTVANDVGARDVQRRSSQWTSGKMFDTFCPLGPTLVTKDEVNEPGKLRITTRLNEVVVQDSSTEKMIFNLLYLVSYISELTTLFPGDIILTGSPKNVGQRPAPRKLMRERDNIVIEIEKLGVLNNPVVAEEKANG